MKTPADDSHHASVITHEYTSFQEFYDAIPLKGSLGILAMGAVGVLAWKKKRFDAGWKFPEPVPPKDRKRVPKSRTRKNG